jgi:hypothetical protein
MPQLGADVFSAMAEATDDVNDVATGARQEATPAAATPAQSTPLAVAAAPVAGSPGPVHAPQAAEPKSEEAVESFDTVLSRVASTLGDSASDMGTFHVSDMGSGGDDAPPLSEDELSGAPDIASRAAMFLAENAPESNDDRIEALRRAGLDGATLASLAEGLRRGGELEAHLLATFGSLAPAPPLPRRAGGLLVVVGAGAQARRLAVALSSEIGGDPADVAFCSLEPDAVGAVAGALVIRSSEEAAELAPGWRRSQAAVVAVDSGVTSTERSWARSLIGSLRPSAVWGVVDATAKSEDICSWATALGGIDALALENIDATVSPAASLASGIPVARLDGHPANAARWTATIVDRVTPCG